MTRRRWILTKVGALLAATLIVSAIISALVTWWSGTPTRSYGNRFEGAQFDTQNIVPVAFALFAVALGLAAAALFRRVLPALATVVGVYIAVRIVVAVYLRPHYMSAVTRLYVLSKSSPVPSGSWTMRETVADPAVAPPTTASRCLRAAIPPRRSARWTACADRASNNW